MSMTQDQKKSLLSSYGKQRDRVSRGAQGALVAGGLVTFAGKKKLAPAAAALGGAVGFADKVLEEKLLEEKLQKLQKSQEGGMKKVSSDYGERDGMHILSDDARQREKESFQGMIAKLFSEKGRRASTADKQLKTLFPSAGPKSYSHPLRAGVSAGEASSRVRAAFRAE